MDQYRKADQDKDIIQITQDVVKAIQVLPGCSCAMSFAICIQAMSKATDSIDII